MAGDVVRRACEWWHKYRPWRMSVIPPVDHRWQGHAPRLGGGRWSVNHLSAAAPPQLIGAGVKCRQQQLRVRIYPAPSYRIDTVTDITGQRQDGGRMLRSPWLVMSQRRPWWQSSGGSRRARSVLAAILCVVVSATQMETAAAQSSTPPSAAASLSPSAQPASHAADRGPGTSELWNFQVLLDDKPIGSHRFERTALEEGGYRVVSEASFAVKLLFAMVYSYQHRAEEHWRDGCLRRLESQTNDNGHRYRIQAESAVGAAGLQVRSGAERQLLPGCVFSFAYWDRAMLERARLLNAQDGEYVSVGIQDGGSDDITVSGRGISAQRYELRSEKLAIDLWYSASGRWVALESRTPRGQRLRYQLQ